MCHDMFVTFSSDTHEPTIVVRINMQTCTLILSVIPRVLNISAIGGVDFLVPPIIYTTGGQRIFHAISFAPAFPIKSCVVARRACHHPV